MSAPAFGIRPMRPDDIAAVTRIGDALNEAPYWTPEVYARAIDPAAVPPRIALVAEGAESGITGFLVTVLVPPHAELETLAVAKPAQRQGIARRLFAALILALEPLQVTQVLLEVRESNHPARALYASLGFIETGRRGSYYSDPKEDAILLHRSLR